MSAGQIPYRNIGDFLTGMDIKTIRNHRRTPDINLELEISSIIDEYSSLNSNRFSA